MTLAFTHWHPLVCGSAMRDLIVRKTVQLRLSWTLVAGA
jgi:hypothetical protein